MSTPANLYFQDSHSSSVRAYYQGYYGLPSVEPYTGDDNETSSPSYHYTDGVIERAYERAVSHINELTDRLADEHEDKWGAINDAAAEAVDAWM